jgi:hypothetical protein
MWLAWCWHDAGMLVTAIPAHTWHRTGMSLATSWHGAGMQLALPQKLDTL